MTKMNWKEYRKRRTPKEYRNDNWAPFVRYQDKIPYAATPSFLIAEHARLIAAAAINGNYSFLASRLSTILRHPFRIQTKASFESVVDIILPMEHEIKLLPSTEIRDAKLGRIRDALSLLDAVYKEVESQTSRKSIQAMRISKIAKAAINANYAPLSVELMRILGHTISIRNRSEFESVAKSIQACDDKIGMQSSTSKKIFQKRLFDALAFVEAVHKEVEVYFRNKLSEQSQKQRK